MSARQDPIASVTHVSDVAFSNLGLSPQVTLRLGIVNATGRSLTVVTRNGLKFTIPTQRVLGDRAIYFREGIDLQDGAELSLNPTDEPFQAEPTTAQRLYDSLKARTQGVHTSRTQRESRAHTQITLLQLIEAGGTVYIRTLDVVVSIHANRSVIKHPFSNDGILNAMEQLELDDASLRLAFYLVDNNRTHGDRYMNINGRIFRVPVRNRPEAEDGFYAVHPVPSKVGGVSGEYRAIKMSIEDADKAYLLYRTPEEAETFGFSKEALERENLARKREQGQRQEEREDEKFERSERERRYREEREAWQRSQEDRAAIRRDIVDILKFVSAIVITVTGFCATVLKLKKS